MMLRSRRLAALTVTAVLGIAGPAAAATWVGNGGGKARVTATTLAPPSGVSHTLSGTVVTINVITAPRSGPVPTAYRVDRTVSGTTAVGVCTVTADSAGLGSCTDTGSKNNKLYTYTVFSRIGNLWVSASAASEQAQT